MSEKQEYISHIAKYKLTRNRVFTTYEQQINILRNRHLNFTKYKSTDAENILKKNYYYKLINGYKEYFFIQKNNNDDYSNIDFQELLDLYLFDEELRAVLFKSLIRFECEFKSIVSYVFMEKHTPYGYLEPNRFANTSISNNRTLDEVIDEIVSNILESTKRKQTIQHFFDKGEVVPFYALIGALSFGTINNFYKYMLPNEQKIIANSFNLKNVKKFSQMVNRLNTLRNICAHSERLFSYKFEYNEGKTVVRFFDVINKFGYFSQSEEIRNIRNDIIRLLIELKKQINEVTFDKVKTEMGIPQNYPDL